MMDDYEALEYPAVIEIVLPVWLIFIIITVIASLVGYGEILIVGEMSVTEAIILFGLFVGGMAGMLLGSQALPFLKPPPIKWLKHRKHGN